MKDRQAARPRIDATMHAIRLHAPGGPAGLMFEQVETPSAEAREALIRIYAAAITRDELDWPVEHLPAILSYEFSGVVVAVGPEVDDLTIGDPVYALCGFDRDSAAAEYAAVPNLFLAPKPRTLGCVECAAIPLAALSAWQGLFDHGQLQKGQRVLIHGAAGGVGSYAVQLARQRGAYVIGPVSTPSVKAARDLGADQVVDHTTTRFEDAVEPVDLVFDTAGGDRPQRSPAVLRAGCRLVSVAEEPPHQRASRAGSAPRTSSSSHATINPCSSSNSWTAPIFGRPSTKFSPSPMPEELSCAAWANTGPERSFFALSTKRDKGSGSSATDWDAVDAAFPWIWSHAQAR